jgi:hypothetical protein
MQIKAHLLTFTAEPSHKPSVGINLRAENAPWRSFIVSVEQAEALAKELDEAIKAARLRK